MQAFRPPQPCRHPEQALVSGCDVGRLHRSIRIGRIKTVDESLGHHGSEEAGPSEVEQLRARIAALEAQIKKGGA